MINKSYTNHFENILFNLYTYYYGLEEIVDPFIANIFIKYGVLRICVLLRKQGSQHKLQL